MSTTKASEIISPILIVAHIVNGHGSLLRTGTGNILGTILNYLPPGKPSIDSSSYDNPRPFR